LLLILLLILILLLPSTLLSTLRIVHPSQTNSWVSSGMVFVKPTGKGGGQECPPHISLDQLYEYRRKLPHYRPAGRRLFITFCKGNRYPFPPSARDAVLQHCLYDHGRRYQLHAAVVMPDHVHLLLTPLRDEKGWPAGLPAILKLLKGTSARSVNKLSGCCGPVWLEESFDHVLRSQESFAEKLEYIRQNPVRRGLVKTPEEYPWLWLEPCEPEKCGTDTLVRRFWPCR
jgi:putative transposase